MLDAHLYVVSFVVYKEIENHHQLTSLVERFTRELMRSTPDLLVISGLRQLLAAEALQGILPCLQKVLKCRTTLSQDAEFDCSSQDDETAICC